MSLDRANFADRLGADAHPGELGPARKMLCRVRHQQHVPIDLEQLMNQPIANSRPAVPPPTPAHYRVVVGSDFSALGDRAVLEGLRICTQYPRAELHVLTV